MNSLMTQYCLLHLPSFNSSLSFTSMRRVYPFSWQRLISTWIFFTHLLFLLTSLLFSPVFTGPCYSYCVLKWRYFPRFLPQNLLFSLMILQTLTYSIYMFIAISIDTYIVTTYYVLYSARWFFCPLKNNIFFNPQIKSMSWILLFREQNRFRNIKPILRNHIVSQGTEKAKVLCMDSIAGG